MSLKTWDDVFYPGGQMTTAQADNKRRHDQTSIHQAKSNEQNAKRERRHEKRLDAV